MPAPPKYDPPCEQARAGLERARAQGLSFNEAWDRVVGRVGKPGEVQFAHATTSRRSWREILEATRPEWQAAYDGVPSALSRALAALEALDESTFAVPAGSGAMREVFVPGSVSVRGRGMNGLGLDSRKVLDGLFRRNDARRALQTAA
jgi:hypothetical protein